MKFISYSKEHFEKKKLHLKPGNFIVTTGGGFIDRLIQFSTMSKWNHAALVIDSKGTVIDVIGTGIRKLPLSTFSQNDYHIVNVEMSDEDRKQVVAYAAFMLKKHAKYGFVTIASIVLKILTHSRLVIKLDGTLICSEFVANALAEGGVIWDKDTSLITPADLYNKFIA